MDTVADEGSPGTIADGTIDSRFEVTLLDAPRHTVEEERGARHLLATIVGIRDETRVPQSVFSALTLAERLTHQQEVLLQLLIILVLWREQVHATHEGRIHPTVAATPVAVLAVGGGVGRYVVLIAPPETLLRIEETTSEGVTRPEVHLHRVVGVAAFARHLIGLHVDGHRHLDGIDPRPPAVERPLGLRLLLVGRLHLVVEVLQNWLDLLVAATLHITVEVGLSAALVVGIVGLHTVAGGPLVEVAPAVGIVDVARILVDLIERHQSLVIHGTCPQRRGSHTVDVGGQCGVGILDHKVIVHLTQRLHYVAGGLALRQRAASHHQGE